MSELPYLNLGCGNTFHKGWTNIDFVSTAPEVMAHNLLQGIPHPDNSFEAVYHSHVLEHFPKHKAPEFIKECYRVLKPGGIIRVAVPDLERIAQNYLKYMQEAMNNIPKAAEKYEWTMMEMYDQVVRTRSGGDMVDYIRDSSKNNDAFLLERNGKETEKLIEVIRNSKKESQPEEIAPQGLRARLREKLLKRWLGENYKELMDSATFRSQGEIHQWMYDRYSLKLLLEKSGFRNGKVVSAFESEIKGWSSFELDGKNSEVRKPDSLFMEAVK